MQAETWRRFSHWVRYFLLQFKLPRTRSLFGGSFYHQQNDQLTLLIKVALEERHYAPLTSEQLIRMTKLAVGEIRRNRLPLSIRDILKSEVRGRELLFGFIEKRMDLTALPGAVVSPWKIMAERNEKFRLFQEGRMPPKLAAASIF